MLLNCGVGEDSWESLGLQADPTSQSLKEISPECSLEAVGEAETPKLWQHDEKNWLNGKDPNVGKDWRQEEKWTIEDEMVGWHHQLNKHEFEQALGVGDGQGSLLCCSLWGLKELDMTERLNWVTEGSWTHSFYLWGASKGRSFLSDSNQITVFSHILQCPCPNPCTPPQPSPLPLHCDVAEGDI